ncbi:YciI family protein [Accumulibacter sp.]|uniref:YciI family protein n=1 Tax=Accumulibacter sp. TaxID=2053492 RepID=UPI0028C3BD64|nr:YciI family protein [Accumulibacter sp.]
MRFLIIVKATPESETETSPASDEQLLAAMAGFHQELAKAGALLDAAGLKPSSAGWRIRYHGQRREVVDGPFAEGQELIAGYTLIQARDCEEALAWSRRFPNPRGQGLAAEIEVRPLYAIEDFPPPAKLERFKALELPT